MPTTYTNPAKELVSYLEKHVARCRAEGWLASLFHVRVTEDIAGDVLRHEAKAAAIAHKAECSDNEAARLLITALEDGRLDGNDVPLLREALKHIHASSRADHEITEHLA